MRSVVLPDALRARPLRSTLLVLAAVAAVALQPPAACARHLARLDPTEPIFTQRAFVETNLELDSSWDHVPDENDVELAPGASLVLWQALELDVELPIALRVPEHAATVGSVGDVGFAAQLLLCCAPDGPLDYLSIRGEVAAPTGSLARETGGIGSWSVSLLPARRFTIAEQLPDLLLQAQLAWQQDIRAETAPGGGSMRQQAFVWNLAFAQQYWAGRFRPVGEVLGTTVVDAADARDEGTFVELAGGFWIAPFEDETLLSPVSFGIGFKWPLTDPLESEVTGLLITEWSFGT